MNDNGFVSDADLELYGGYDDYVFEKQPELDSYGKTSYIRQPEFEPNVPRQVAPTKKRAVTARHSDFSSMTPASAPSIVLKHFKSHDTDPNELLDGYVAKVDAPPIQIRPRDQTIIPYRIYNSALEIMTAHQDKEIRISQETLNDMDALLKCDDEFTKTDPYVVIYDTLSTGSCNIYMKEIVPVSILLLAQVLDCQYQLEIMRGVLSDPKPFSKVPVKPFHDSLIDHAQPFFCEEIVREKLGSKADGTIKKVQVMMLQKGVIPSREACDTNFLLDACEEVKKLL